MRVLALVAAKEPCSKLLFALTPRMSLPILKLCPGNPLVHSHQLSNEPNRCFSESRISRQLSLPRRFARVGRSRQPETP